MYFGPLQRSLQRRTVATDKPVIRATSCSSKSSTNVVSIVMTVPSSYFFANHLLFHYLAIKAKMFDKL